MLLACPACLWWAWPAEVCSACRLVAGCRKDNSKRGTAWEVTTSG